MIPEDDVDRDLVASAHTVAADAADAGMDVRVAATVQRRDVVRRADALARLRVAGGFRLHPLRPSTPWLGSVVAVRQIDTRVQYLPNRPIHVFEQFSGIGCSTLRTALAAGAIIGCLTMVERDSVSRRIAKRVVRSLQQEYPGQLPDSTILGWDKRVPQDVALISGMFLE